MSQGGAQKAPQRLAQGDSPAAKLLQDAARQGAQVPAGARERVLRRLQQGSAPRRKIAWAVALGGALAAAAVLVAVRPSADVGQLAESSGAVQLARAGHEPQPLAAGAQLRAGATVQVQQGAQAVLQLGPVRAALSSGSSAELARAGLSLSQGAVAVSVRASRTFVAAGPFRVEAHDAVFMVRAHAQRIEVLVQQGAVRVRGAGSGGEVSLAEGASWSSEGQPAAANDDERALIRRAEGLPPIAAAAAPASAAAAAPVPAQPSADAAAEATAAQQASAEAVAAPGPAPAKRKRRLLARAPAAAPAAPPAPATALEEGDEALHARARAAEREARYDEAASLYAKLGARQGPHAESALYELARVQERFLHRPAAALASIEEHRRRFPRGALAHEAALTAVELRLALGGGEPALREMDDFLSRWGRSERAPEVRWLRASLLVDRGECARARPDLLALAASGPRAEPAVFALASCARAAGDLDEARARLSEYLRRFPDGRRRAEAEAALRGEARP